MRRAWNILQKIVAVIALFFLLLVGAAIAIARTDTTRAWLREKVSTTLEQDLGLDASFRDVEIQFFPPRLNVFETTVNGSDGEPFVTVERLTVGLSPSALLRGNIEVSELTLEEPDVHLIVEGRTLVNLPQIRRRNVGENNQRREGLGRYFNDLGILAGQLTVEIRETSIGPVEIVLSNTNVDVTIDRSAANGNGGHPSARILIADGTVTQGDETHNVDVIQGRVLLRDDEAIIHDLQVSIEGVRVSLPRAVIGTTAPFDVEANGQVWIPLDWLHRLPLSIPVMQGTAHASFDFTRENGRHEARGTLEIENLIIEPFQRGNSPQTFGPNAVGTIITDFHYVPEAVTCSELVINRLRENDGRLIVRSLRVGLTDDLPITGEIEFDDMQLANILIDAGLYASRVRLRIFGTSTLQGRLRDLRLRFLPLDLQTRDFEVLTKNTYKDDAELVLGIPTARVRGTVEIDKEFVHLRDMSISFGQTLLTVVAQFGFKPKLWSLHASTPQGGQFRFEDIGGQIAGLRFAGQGRVNAHIEGSYNDPGIRSTFDFRNFELGNIDFGHVRGPLNYQSLLITLPSVQGRRNESEFQFNEGRVDFRHGGLSVTGVAQFAPLHISDAIEMFELTGHPARGGGIATGQARINYTSRSNRWQVDVETEVANATFADHPLGSGAAEVRYDRGNFTLDRVFLTRSGAQASATGTVSREGEVDLDVALSGLPLSEIHLLPEPLDTLRGKVRGRAHLTGTTSFLRGTGTVELSPVLYAGTRFGPSRVRFVLDGPELQLSGGIGGRLVQLEELSLVMRPPYPIWIRGRIQGLELTNIVGPETFPEGMQIQLDSTIDAGFDVASFAEIGRDRSPNSARPRQRGERRRDYGMSGWVNIESLTVQHPSLAIRNVDPVHLDLQRDRANLSSAAFTFRSTDLPLPTRFNLGGWASIDGLGLELRARNLDLAFVPDLLDSVSELEGTLDVDCEIIGTPSAPALLGNSQVRIDRLALSGLEQYVATQLRGAIRFSRNVVLLEDLRARLLGGDLTGSGRVTLGGLSLEDYRLEATVYDAQIPLGPRSSTVVNGTINLQSPRTENGLPYVGGQLDVVRLRYTEPIELVGDIENVTRRRRSEVQTYDPGGDSIRLDLRLTGRSNLRIENNLAEASIIISDQSRPFRLVGTNQVQSFLGTLRLVRHGTLIFRDTVFDVDRGVLEFTDPFEFNPSIDLVASAVRRDWTITLRVSGTANDPTIRFSSEPVLSEEDIALLLTVGLTREETEQLGYGSAATSVVPELLWNLSGVDEEVSRLVPMLDEIRITTDYSERTGRTEPRVLVAQRLSRNVRIGASTSLTDSTDFEANLEVQLGENLSFEAGYEKDTDFGFGNIGGDLRWRMEF